MYYIYKVTNIINNKIYIGYHFSTTIDTDPYIGSGTIFKRALKKYGKHNFIREILFEFSTLKDVLLKEAELVDNNFVKQSSNYNVNVGGNGCPPLRENSYTHLGKISIYNSTENRHIYIFPEDLDNYLNIGWVPGTSKKNFYPVKHKSNDMIIYVHKDQLSDLKTKGYEQYYHTKNKIVVYNKLTDQIKFIRQSELEYYEALGYIKGQPKSGVNKGRTYMYHPITLQNKRVKSEEVDHFVSKGFIIGKYQKPKDSVRIYNIKTFKEKTIDRSQLESFINNDWIVGTSPNRKYNNSKNVLGKIWINNGTERKYTTPEQLESYLQSGWIKGFYI